jgi:hypothetical protein
MSQYTKLYKSIITSSVWQESKETKLVWITLLALCEKDGTVNGAVPGLAHIAGVTIPECVRAIGDLEKPDPYSRTKEHEGRRIKTIEGGWLVLNKEKYTYEDADRRDYYKEYNAQRAQVRTSKHRVHTHKDKDKDKDEEKEREEGLRPIFSLQLCKDTGHLIGITDDKCESFYNHYNAQGWLMGNGLKITDLQSALVKWRNNAYKFPAAKSGLGSQAALPAACLSCGKPGAMFAVMGEGSYCGAECRTKYRSNRAVLKTK